MFTYSAVVTRVVDGDTFHCNIDLGFRMGVNDMVIRMADINAPEMSTEAGRVAKQYLVSRIEGKEIILRTYKPDKYGRWLGVVFVEPDKGSVNAEMVAKGLAVPYMVNKEDGVL
jgi:endonuclease YncB( thermonuclease family)